jgi:ABC-type glycerol-3-phosphate transport system permease component
MTYSARAFRLGISAVWIVIVLFPIYQMILVSFLPLSKFLQSSLYASPADFTLVNYRRAFSGGGISWRIYLNSAFVGGVTAVLATVIATLAGYSLARFRFFGSRFFERSILLVYIVPPILLVVPIYVFMVNVGLYNTYTAVILIHTMLVLPFSIWLLNGFFRDIPKSLDEAARVDGASRLAILFRIILPMSLPGLTTIFVFVLIESWNEFLFASVMISTEAKKTFPIGLYSVAGTLGDVRWGETMAASTIGALPMFGVFLLFQRWLVSGLTSGAVKG